MTSKISYFKLIRLDIRHRGWLAALTALGLFLAMPVFTMLYVDSYLGSAADGGSPAYVYEDLRNLFPGLLNGNSVYYLAAAIAGFAVLAALTGFAFIHSKEKLDFYHSLPVKRGQWFVVSYISGLLIFVVPYVICAALTAAVGGMNGLLTQQVAENSAVAVLGGLLFYLLIYHTCILAAVLTGQTVTGILASLVIAVYPSLLFGMFSVLTGTFFDTYEAKARLMHLLMETASPAGLSLKLIASTALGTFPVTQAVSAVIILLLLLAGAFILYRIYPSEAAGNSLAFPRTAPVFKVLITIPAALFFSVFGKQFLGSAGTKWIFALSLLTSVILCAVIEFIYQQDLRMLLKGWRSSLISIAGVLAVLFIFQFDVFGYDSWMPDQNKIEKISIQSTSFWGYFEYPENITGAYDDKIGYAGSEDGLETLCQLAQTGIANLEEGITPEALDLGSTDSDIAKEYVNVSFCYQLKSGREAYRRYCINREEILSALEELSRDEEFRKELFPIFHVDHSEVLSVFMRDVYGLLKNTELNAEQREKLLDAYEKDVLAVDMRTLSEEMPVGELVLQMTDPNTVGAEQRPGDQTAENTTAALDMAGSEWDSTISVDNFYIYKEYTNTLACLEEYGYVPREQIAPEDVKSITMYIWPETVQDEGLEEMLSALSDRAERLPYDDGSEAITVWAQEDIQIVLGHLKVWNSGILGNGGWLGNYADIQYVGGTGMYSYKIE